MLFSVQQRVLSSAEPEEPISERQHTLPLISPSSLTTQFCFTSEKKPGKKNKYGVDHRSLGDESSLPRVLADDVLPKQRTKQIHMHMEGSPKGASGENIPQESSPRAFPNQHTGELGHRMPFPLRGVKVSRRHRRSRCGGDARRMTPFVVPGCQRVTDGESGCLLPLLFHPAAYTNERTDRDRRIPRKSAFRSRG